MYAPVSELARAKVQLDLVRQQRTVSEDFGGVLGGVDTLLRHLVTLGKLILS